MDIGHIDVVYIWFLNRCDRAYQIEGKYVNEATKDAPVIPYKYDEKIYLNQIVDKIL